MFFDTDILSMLGKTGSTAILSKLFSKSELLITFEVYNELLRAREAGYDFVDDILAQGFRVMHLDPDLFKEYEQKKKELKNIHAGELTSILLCKKIGMDFATNDNKAKKFCKEYGVEWIDIIDILRLCYLKKLLERSEIEKLISDIEEKDMTRIRNIERIFADIENEK
jgi:predicted nucleic acid-binding protein